MKARIWRKLHAQEASRFDQVYALMAKHPEVPLPDAFGAIQSGLTVEEFLSRKSRTQKKEAVKEARSAVPGDAVSRRVEQWIAKKTELAVVLAERTLLDVLVGVERVAFVFEKAGRLEKLQVVLVARRGPWEQRGPTLERDARLAQKPMPIARQPEKRPVSDPRPFQDKVGQVLRLTLRNGVKLSMPLLEYGPFDLVLGTAGDEVFVPLHALFGWEA